MFEKLLETQISGGVDILFYDITILFQNVSYDVNRTMYVNYLSLDFWEDPFKKHKLAIDIE